MPDLNEYLVSRLQSAFNMLGTLPEADRRAATLPDIDEIRSTYAFMTSDPGQGEWGKGSLVFTHPSNILRKMKFFLRGNYSTVIVGNLQRCDSAVFSFNGGGNVAILGDGVKLKDFTISSAGKKNIAVVGQNTQIQGAAIMLLDHRQHVVVGDSCLFSSDITISTGDGHPIYDLETKERINPAAPVVIERSVWLGRGVRVNKGIRLGSGGVVAQGSIVTKDTEENSIYGGVPAKLLRKGIAWRKNTSDLI